MNPTRPHGGRVVTPKLANPGNDAKANADLLVDAFADFLEGSSNPGVNAT